MPKKPNTKYQQRLARARMEGAEAVLIALTEAWRNGYALGPQGADLFSKLVYPAQKAMAKYDYEYKVLLGLMSRKEAEQLLNMKLC